MQRPHDGHVVIQRHRQQVEQRDRRGHGVERKQEDGGAVEGLPLVGDGGDGVEDLVEGVAHHAQAEQDVGQAQAEHQLDVGGHLAGAEQRGGDGEQVGRDRQEAQQQADDGHGLAQDGLGSLLQGGDRVRPHRVVRRRQVRQVRHAGC